jgi:Sortase domain
MSNEPELEEAAPGRSGRVRILATTAVLSAAVIAAIVGFLVLRSVGTLAGASSSTAPTTPPPTVPSVTYPTAPPATASSTVVPTGLVVPKIGVDAPIDGVGIESGTNEIEVPPIERVGWYRFGAPPGGSGSAVLLGHVDGEGKEGVFFRLGSLEPGDPVQVSFADGTTRSFHVVGRAQFPKQALPADFFSRGGPSRLVLITCGGSFDESIGHYRDNVVVVAEPDA